MEERIRKLNAEYGFNLSEDEIQKVLKLAEANERLFRRLYEADLGDLPPAVKLDRRPRR